MNSITALVERNVHLYQLHDHTLPGSGPNARGNDSQRITSETLAKDQKENRK